MPNNAITAHLPIAFKELFTPCRYKIYYGGRGGGKSWGFAIALILLSYEKKLRILCTREYQRSIKDSVHKLLTDTIGKLNLTPYFKVTERQIKCSRTGSEFIFLGTHHNASEIKSTEGINICWVEEAQSVSAESWDVLIPTIRAEKSEIWVSFNPFEENAPTYQRFVVNPPSNAIVRKVNYYDNPYINETLLDEIERSRKAYPDDFAHIWLGECKRISDALIFKNKFIVEHFDIPKDVDRWFIGADWGFSKDPSAITASFVKDNKLYIAYEAGGTELDFPELVQLFDSFPDNLCRIWAIKADSARPETINYINKAGFPISAAKKWQGSVEDGISHLRAFDKIIIHPNCKNTAQEFYSYSYKVDKQTGDILPVIEDKNNHYIDSIRYAFDGYIRSKGSVNYNEVNKSWFSF